MIRNLIWALLLILCCSACNNNPSHSIIVTDSILNDSLYQFRNYTGLVKNSVPYQYLDKCKNVDSNTRKKILTGFYPFDSSSWSLMTMVYYSKLHTVGNIQPIILHINADDYGAFVLVTINNHQQVIDRFTLSGGIDGGPDEADDSILAFAPDSYGFISDSSHIQYFRLTSRYAAWPNTNIDSLNNQSINPVNYDSIPTIDSLSYKLEIRPTGKIISTFLDSVHIDMHKKSNL